FLLDINQTGSKPLISLNKIQVFLGNAPDLSPNTFSGGVLNFGGNATLVYNLDGGSGGNGTIELDFSLNSGSGSGDMFAYIPNALFTGSNQWVYLYSQFGDPNATNDGFEEWATINGVVLPNNTPEPASLLLAATGLAGLGLARFRRMVR